MTAGDTNELLYGYDVTERIVAAELAGQDRVRLFFRDAGGAIQTSIERFEPWLVTTTEGAAAASGGRATILNGDLPLSRLMRFPTWRAYLDTYEQLTTQQIPLHRLGSPVDQYLALSGRTLFKGMAFDDLVRLQLDIETTGLDATVEDARILAIAVASNRGHETVLSQTEMSERELLDALTRTIRDIDPDVIEGHNLYNFDLPFLIERARRTAATLSWGRDGSQPRLHGTQRFKAGARSIPFQGASISGRHIIDTYQQIQRYDYAGEMQSYGLKEAIAALGLVRAGRVFIEGASVGATWEDNHARVLDYALDDVRDVALLSGLATPTEFYQTQLLPRNFQSVAVGGPGEKINVLLTRIYLAAGHSLPLPRPPRAYPGGYTDVRRVGVFRPVVKCDVESLYPAIMLVDRIAPATDVLGVYLPLLQALTDRRLHAKRQARVTDGAEQARWAGLQSSFKVLINSFSGNLGYSRALFNDYVAAARVTLRGQELIQKVVAELEIAGAEPIEIDTDGVYFQPPADVTDSEAIEAFVAEISATLPSGINLAHDGTYRGMASLRTKNYALLTLDDRMVLRGSGLRSRRDEPILRRFIANAANAFISGSRDTVRDLYLDTADLIQRRQLTTKDVTRWETITEKTFTSDANRRIADAAGDERIGERVPVYQRTGGSLAPIEEYANDEDVDYLLRRLRDAAHRFEPLIPDSVDFDYTFPKLTQQTDLRALRDTLPARQLSLFG